MPVRKWYFATNVNGLRNAFNQIEGAVRSAKQNTSLQAYCILDDRGSESYIDDRIRWIEEQGVTVIRHQASLLDELVPVFGDQMNIFSGHWLRCDIAQIENEDQFVLYTDIDVVFERDVCELTPSPALLACGPEHSRGDTSYFNSGVMVINVPAFGGHRDKMVSTLRSRLATTAPYDDQSMLNELFAGQWDHLADEWNWKPYWGANDDAIIVHWHGPKPNHVTEMKAGELDKFGPDYRTIYLKDVAGYDHYLKRFSQYT